jgi:hypothetical protein
LAFWDRTARENDHAQDAFRSAAPDGRQAHVLGFTPWELKPDYLRSMTLVMGQRNRLSWDIPAADSFPAQPGDLPPPR